MLKIVELKNRGYDWKIFREDEGSVICTSNYGPFKTIADCEKDILSAATDIDDGHAFMEITEDDDFGEKIFFIEETGAGHLYFQNTYKTYEDAEDDYEYCVSDLLNFADKLRDRA